jgi:protocatechuate 3,4-dioxygenase beta subunit
MTDTNEPRPLLPDDPAVEPPALHAPYASTLLRAPAEAPIELPPAPAELTGPQDLWAGLKADTIDDLTTQHTGPPGGQRIIISGHVLDDRHRPIGGTLVEIWQANAAGRYAHARDQWDAPLDPNFTGVGRMVTDEAGHYRFVTIRPGAYPWGNHYNAWRPAHVHFSVFGPAIGTRLVTQMYFPDDPLLELDPIANAIPMPYRQRLVARWDLDTTVPSWALGYRFDVVLRGRDATPPDVSP